MKKLSLLLSALILQGNLSASDYDYEVSLLGGVNFAEPNYTIENQYLINGEMQFNNLSFGGIAPELSVLYSFPSEYRRIEGKTSLTRAGVNGVYEFTESNNAIPFLKAGLGYEFVDHELDGNTDGVFVDAGAGAKIKITDDWAFKLEGLYLVKYRDEANYDSNFDNNFLVMAGLTYRFGYNAPAKVAEPEPAVVAPVVVVAAVVAPKDGDKDGVIDANDKCLNTPKGLAVDAKGCMLDDDNDGIANAQDRCPNTHSWAEVDASGCAIKMSVHIDYALDSATIPADKAAEVTAFAAFLKKEPYAVQIIGHTDSSGKKVHNLKLSTKRAQSLKDALIAEGISADRILVTGKGEEEPIATNSTKEGQAENRRIEIVLINPK